jgi:4-hydroxy-2-oxoheptanedioate aldolase
MAISHPAFPLAARLRAGETVFSTWNSMASPLVAEIGIHEGFPVAVLDQQHGLWDQTQVLAGIGAIRQAGGSPIARVPLDDFGTVSRFLDWGAEGVIMPMINNVETAKRFVAVAKFPPLGERSWGPHRATMFAGMNDQKDYLRQANDLTLTLAMIETQEALDNMDAIAAVPGIDMLFVGPGDLSIALTKGADVDPGGKLVDAALVRIAAAAKKAGKIAGAFTANAERAKQCAAMGFTFITVATDMAFLRAGIAAQLKGLKS